MKGAYLAEQPDELKGRLKEKAVRLLGNEPMEAEGSAAREAAVTQRRVAGAIEEAKGTAKALAGAVTKKRRLQAEGEVERAGGRTRDR